ncbi:hypothetical protein A3K73_01125 [Candidatus Pacearchaeota archaeon RBG_13_36_9]|nr:MAG: hypothetical protein A3K73_01125 [Candidatus Pacearchaeota archaeon RBG_13_36_9]
MYFTFTDPKYLFLLLVVPLIVFIYLLTLKSIKKRALKFANFDAIARVQGVSFFSRDIVTTILSSIIVLVLVLSVSGLTLHRQASASSFSFVIAIDVSRSMEARDLLPTRLDAAKETAKEFVNAAPSTTKIAVISFSGNSYIHQSLTDKKDMVIDALDSVEISAIEGTDLYEAVVTSSNLLVAEESRAIVLLSDGQVNVGELEDAIRYANQNDIIINTIAIGTKEGGETVYGISKLNEDTMKALSYNTEGDYFDAQDKQSLLDSMGQILKLAKKKVSIDLSGYLVLVSILLFVIEYILISSRYRLLPF